VVSGQAPEATFDKDPFDLIAAHHQSSKTSSYGEKLGQFRVVVESLKLTVDGEPIVHDASSDICTLSRDPSDEVVQRFREFNELIKIDDYDPLFGPLRELSHLRDGFRAAGETGRGVEIMVLNNLIISRCAVDGIRQMLRCGYMEFGNAKLLVMSQKMGQQALIIDNANEKLQVHSPNFIEIP
jgi:hypothetical protein